MIKYTVLTACCMLCTIWGALSASAQLPVRKQPLVTIDRDHVSTGADHKTDLERLFWDDGKCDAEFLVIPPFEGAFGFRVCKTSSDASYIIEVMRIVNFEDVNK